MRAAGAPGRADLAERLAALDLVARLHAQRRHVKTRADHAVTVIDVDAVAGQEVLVGNHDAPRRDRPDRIALVDRIVAAGVLALDLAVECAQAAEVVLVLRQRRTPVRRAAAKTAVLRLSPRTASAPLRARVQRVSGFPATR
jgi:hypothetical protein